MPCITLASWHAVGESVVRLSPLSFFRAELEGCELKAELKPPVQNPRYRPFQRLLGNRVGLDVPEQTVSDSDAHNE